MYFVECYSTCEYRSICDSVHGLQPINFLDCTQSKSSAISVYFGTNGIIGVRITHWDRQKFLVFDCFTAPTFITMLNPDGPTLLCSFIETTQIPLFQSSTTRVWWQQSTTELRNQIGFCIDNAIHQSPVDSTHKGQVMWKAFPSHDVIMHTTDRRHFCWWESPWSFGLIETACCRGVRPTSKAHFATYDLRHSIDPITAAPHSEPARLLALMSPIKDPKSESKFRQIAASLQFQRSIVVLCN